MLTEQPPYSGKSPETAYETLRTIVFVLMAAFLVRSFVAQPFVVQGRSMEPTFRHQEYLVVDKVKYRLEHPERGDIIVFRAPEDPSQNYIKRIIALPGERVTIQDSTVSINGQRLAETYLNQNVASDDTSGSFFLEKQLGPTEYFVLGDNRNHSSDSRSWGPLPAPNIIGRVLVTVFPLRDFGLIRQPEYQILTQ
ncbi:signal peptidase I [Candidatus Berkelbacteria bacterium]|nr:signal peptidase I [Candidatus Berkelbacteria bacterium]